MNLPKKRDLRPPHGVSRVLNNAVHPTILLVKRVKDSWSLTINVPNAMPLTISLLVTHQMFVFVAIAGLTFWHSRKMLKQGLSIIQVKENCNMIKIRIKDLHQDSPRCADKCGLYNVSGCPRNCSLRLRTAFSCPYCKTIRCFYGGNNPLVCHSCKRSLPDMYLMKSDMNNAVRVIYHLNEDT